MGDVDHALARVFARREPTAGGAPVPPAPHFPFERADASEPRPAPGVAHAAGSGVQLEWPATVRALEREHGDRFEALADALESARYAGVRSLYFTSCHRSEGRSTLVLGLARALARRPVRTVLVDADLTGPMLARSFGLRPRWGLDDVIEGNATLDDVLLDAPDDHLAVVPLRSAVARPRESLVSPRWGAALSRLRRDFDHVLIDGSPLFAGFGGVELPRMVDAAVLVHNKTLTGARAILRAREVLEVGGLPLLGLAETFV